MTNLSAFEHLMRASARRWTVLAQLRHIIAAAALVVVAIAAAPAAAQTFTASVTTDPNLGNVVAASTGVTTFRFGTNGSVTTISGSAVRASSGTVRGVVQIACSGTGNICNGAVSRVRIGSIGSTTGKAGALSNFTVAIASGGSITNVTGTDPVDFTLTQTNKNNQPVVYFGADIPINGNDGGGSVGSATSGYYVYVAPSPTVPSTGVSGNLTAVVSRPISFTGTPSLNFGAIMKPRAGNGSVTLNPSTNIRTVSGNGAGGVSNPTPSRASYTVTGEGGQTISVSVPASFAMTGPGGASITVTLITSGLPTALSAAPGTEGSASFYVGGSFNMTANTATGDYSGTYNVTAQYN
jgi:hypothetical protein